MANQYFKLIIKTLAFMACVVAIDYLAGLFCNKIHEDAYRNSPESFFYENLLYNVRSDILIIGSSTASHHYDPLAIEDSLHLSVFNAGQDGVFFIIQNSIVNMVLDRYTPKVIIWEIGETSLSTRYDTFAHGHNEYQSLKTLFPFYETDLYAFNTVNGKDAYQKYRMMSQSYVNNSLLLANLRAIINKESIENKGYVPLDTLGYEYPSICCDEFDDPINIYKIDALNETIRRCDSLGVRLVLSSSPRLYDDKVLSSQGYMVLKRIATENDIPFVEYYSLFSDKPEYFKDVDHMNERGTRHYMHYFIPSLKQSVN